MLLSLPLCRLSPIHHVFVEQSYDVDEMIIEHRVQQHFLVLTIHIRTTLQMRPSEKKLFFFTQ
jgi:hypothetical protein